MSLSQSWRELKALDRNQRNAVIASFLGWMLDAFDFFVLVVVIDNIADEFKVKVSAVAYAITLTLFMRPLGALIFGMLADRFGRRPILMIDVLLFTGFELASGFAPNLTTLLILRALFGVAMGGEWGIGASLAMETIPTSARGVVSGLLQEGYAVGFLVATLTYGLLFHLVGWRGMFVVGAIPALLVLFIRSGVSESPGWKPGGNSVGDMLSAIGNNWKLFLYIIILMSFFNAFSHGTQDLYKVFLTKQHGFKIATYTTIIICANIGAIAGGISFGTMSEAIGRRRAIITAALLSLLIIPLWSGYFGDGSWYWFALGGFLMQFMVQGAWGVMPVHLNELSPPQVRGTFPGFTYQLGNAVISLAAPIQAKIAEAHGNDYGYALGITAAVVAVGVVLVVVLGPERKGVVMAAREV